MKKIAKFAMLSGSLLLLGACNNGSGDSAEESREDKQLVIYSNASSEGRVNGSYKM
ncbi:Uncharacterised protein [Alloiococcus otitis]|uniref:Uncharacterized protein n=1 Tax=Alloiococcus otitis ATCC 51267 TaxID=883081 RepID=K9EB86_9LACT|nr:hypothetical protein [Alloiococcus otitis]EKU93893.1 hypothetical protein HMPREF9698_00570 [Alloiococcus otitis ATCC 51267]SUU81696.1 Uncharacterised protein [Alloiococcus otitis]